MDQTSLVAQSSKSMPFSAIMKVLVMDKDTICRKMVEEALESFHCEVVSVTWLADALDELHERQGEFDIILVDLDMLIGMDGIALLKQFKDEFNIPIVLMTSSDKEAVALRCMKNGASFYLTKPLSSCDLSNLWQFLYLKKRNESMIMEQACCNLEKPAPGNVSEGNGESSNSNNRRHLRQESMNPCENQNVEQNIEDNSVIQKTRVAWKSVLHQKFLEAINRIGFHRAVPTKILAEMSIPGLTRDQVASHLQKYRKFLKRAKETSQTSKPSAGRPLRPHKRKGQPSDNRPLRPYVGKEQLASDFNRASLPTYNGHSVGIQMRNNANLYGFNQMPISQGASNVINCSYSRLDEIRNGKRPLVDIAGVTSSHPEYISQGLVSPSTTGLIPQELAPIAGLVPESSFHYDYVPQGLASSSTTSLMPQELAPIGGSVPHSSSHPAYACQGFGYSSDLILQGLAPSSGLVPQGPISSAEFPSMTPFLPIPTNVVQELSLFSPPPPPPLSQQQQQEEKNGIRAGEVNTSLESMENISSFSNFSFGDDYLSEIMFMPVNQSPNQ